MDPWLPTHTHPPTLTPSHPHRYGLLHRKGDAVSASDSAAQQEGNKKAVMVVSMVMILVALCSIVGLLLLLYFFYYPMGEHTLTPSHPHTHPHTHTPSHTHVTCAYPCSHPPSPLSPPPTPLTVYVVISLYCIGATVGLYSLLAPFVGLVPFGSQLRYN